MRMSGPLQLGSRAAICVAESGLTGACASSVSAAKGAVAELAARALARAARAAGDSAQAATFWPE
jgi:hypothetical protein